MKDEVVMGVRHLPGVCPAAGGVAPHHVCGRQACVASSLRGPLSPAACYCCEPAVCCAAILDVGVLLGLGAGV